MRNRVLSPALPALLLTGCAVADLAKGAVDVVTLPVKVVGKGVDLATTSQSEADRNRGRALRQADEARARQARALAERCARRRTLPGDLCPAPADPR